MIMLEETKKYFSCPVCGSNDFKVCYSDTLGNDSPSFDYNFNKRKNLTYQIVKCIKCTHHYANPRPIDIYKHYCEDTVDEIYLALQDQRNATALKVLKELAKYAAKGRLLDIGCATGDFLSIASKYFQVEGLELSRWSSKISESRGFKVHKKNLAEMVGSDEFDIITLWGVIEHFEFPSNEIMHIHRLLKPGGFLCIWTGDVDSFLSKLFGKKWWYYQGQHIQMFTRRSINKLLGDNNFSPVFFGMYPYVITFNSINNSLKRYPLICSILRPFLASEWFRNFRLTLRLPGEMFIINRKGTSK